MIVGGFVGKIAVEFTRVSDISDFSDFLGFSNFSNFLGVSRVLLTF